MTTSTTLVPSADQERALNAVQSWFKNDTTEPFVLGGLAGTGKTAMLPMVQEMLGVRVRYVCPTWKAANVLSKKLKGERATSIHELIYNPRGILHEDECGFWSDPESGCTLRCKKLSWEYDPKEKPELLVVDEASMVDARTREDIARLDSPTMYVGDHGQLPPIVGSSIFVDRPLDAKLETILRQDPGSPIIPLSRIVRNGDRDWLKWAERHGFPVLEAGSASARRYDLRAAEPAHSDPETVFIASTNNAVDRLNNLTRRTLGRGPEQLVEGDLVMAQNNNKHLGIYNGQQGRIVKVRGDRVVDLKMETGIPYFGKVLVKGVDELPDYAKIPVLRHSYAVTCHKAQGSEFSNVIVYLTGGRMEDRRWLYTAVTRATQRLTFVVAR